MKRKHTAIQKIKPVAPVSGSEFIVEPCDRTEDISRGLTPENVDKILSAANTGDCINQAKLSLEIEEKNWDVAHAVSTRKNAICACEWEIQCSDTSATAKEAIKSLTSELEGANADALIRMLSEAILPGYALAEIFWKEGGKLEGFGEIPVTAVTFIDSFSPRLILSDESVLQDIPMGKMVVHTMSKGHDIARGGLIRPLAWLHCFSNNNIKDLLTFAERYGQPFIVAKADESALKSDRHNLQRAIKAFGPSGGGMFSKAVEFQLLQAANNSGDIYFNILKYIGDAITKVVLGQTATAGDGGTWSNDSAQSKVRQDILDADCRGIEATINTQIIEVWQGYQYPSLSAPLTLKILSEPPENIVQKFEALKAEVDAMGVAGRAGVLTPSMEIEDRIRERFGLPKMSKEVIAEWMRTEGVRSPITLAQQEEQPPAEPVFALSDAMRQTPSKTQNIKSSEQVMREVVKMLINEGFLTKWLDPVNDALTSAVEGDDDQLDAFLRDPALEFGNSDGLEEVIANQMVTETAFGIAKQAPKGGRK